MTDTEAKSTRESFIRELRRALNYMYDPTVLRKIPLGHVFDVDGRKATPSALQRILVDAIQSLRPARGVPSGSASWRLYHILHYRYAEQFTQAQVANDLGMSERQLRREQQAALDILADSLWSQYNLESKAHLLSPKASEPHEGLSGNGDLRSREQEMEWLQRSSSREAINVGEIITGVLKTVRPLTRAAGLHIKCTVPDDLPLSVVLLAATRQALINIVTAAIHDAPGGRLVIESQAKPPNIHVRFRAVRHHPAPASLPRNASQKLELAAQLIRLSGGSATITSGVGRDKAFSAVITLPAAEQVKVLVIDDNVDTLNLYHRYLSGSRYRFVGVSDPNQVLSEAERLAPEIIVLDVMLPGIDGWQLLGALREHPRTRDVPIVVCTIMPQEQLALALGADAFITKPVAQTAFLSALDEQVTAQVREAR